MSTVKHESLQAVAGPVSRETFDGLVAFEEMFRKWAVRINLSANSTLDDIWNRHILDSAQIASYAPDALHWLDLGSGGGFPGLVIAFLLKDRSGAKIDLVESNRKKTGFLQAAIGEFRLPGQVYAKRIEDVYEMAKQPEVVTARALAPLTTLLELAEPWLAKGATALFHKGREYRQEVEQSTHEWSFDLIEHPSKVDPTGAILEITRLRRNGADLPSEPKNQR